jgi:hypothetical protein
MTTPYCSQVDVTAIGGTNLCVTLPAPARGIVVRLVVKQMSGALDGFTYELYDREDACASVATDSTNPDDLTWFADADIHRIQAKQTVNASANTGAQYGLLLPYINRDEQDPYMRTPKTAIYLDLLAAGSGEKDFSIAVTFTADVVG